MGLGLALVKLLLGVANLVFFLVNLVTSILFAYEVTAKTGMEGVLMIIQLALIGICLVFLFGLWITWKSKYTLLKIYTLLLAAFVVAQVLAVGYDATGGAEADTVLDPLTESLCNTKADANTKLASLRDDIPWCAPTTPRDIQTCPPVPLRWA